MALVAVLVPASWAQAAQSAEVSIQRHFPLPGLLPTEGQYVSYLATIKNTGSTSLTGMRLWASFGTAGSSEPASFAIQDLAPGESRQMNLGPFKMVKTGEHRLYAGINKSGSAGGPNDVPLNLSPDVPADSFMVYGAGLIFAVAAGAAFTAAGGVLVALYLKKRPKSAS